MKILTSVGPTVDPSGAPESERKRRKYVQQHATHFGDQATKKNPNLKKEMMRIAIS